MIALLKDLSALGSLVAVADIAALASGVDVALTDTSSAFVGETHTARKLSHAETSTQRRQITGRLATKVGALLNSVKQRPRLAVGGALVFLMLIFGGVLAWQHITKIETPDGYIVIESNVEDLEVFVDEQRIAYITDPRDNKKIKVQIPKGGKMLRVSKDGFEANVPEFNLQRVKGEIKVSFAPERAGSSGRAPLANVPDTLANRPPLASTLQPNEPLTSAAFVSQPAALPGALSWTVETRQFADGVGGCAFSPNGEFLAASGGDGRVRIYETNSFRLIRVLMADDVRTRWVSWSPDSQYLAASNDRGKLRIWRVQPGELIQTIDTSGGHGWSAWSPDGRHLAYAGVSNGSGGACHL